MKRGSRRGCFRLKTAFVGIDDEDDCTFTIRVDSRTYHFQGACVGGLGYVCGGSGVRVWVGGSVCILFI